MPIPKITLMPIGLIIAAALLAQADDGPGAVPTTAKESAAPECSPAKLDPNSTQIVICAQKPQGYRIDPDVLEAKRQKKEQLAGRPRPPENYKDHSCQVVGPAPCMDAPGVNLLGAVATAAEMARRLSKGEEVGSMFVTDPQMTEYQLYQAARKRRQTKEVEAAAAKAKAAAAQTSEGADAVSSTKAP